MVSETNGGMTGRILILVFFSLSALVFFTYGSCLTFGFLIYSDDRAYIFQNPYLLDLSVANLRDIFTNKYHAEYIPMTLASYSLDYTFWEIHPFGYHLTQIILHSVNSFLALVALLLARVPRLIALGAAFIYAIHPIHVESVVWIADRKNLLSAFFIFLSLICYIRHTQKDFGKWGNYTAALCLFVLALLSKSIAIMLPFIFILYDLCIAERGWKLAEKIPFFAGAIIATGAQVLNMTHTPVGDLLAKNEHVGGSYSTTALYMLRIYWDYLSSLIFPFFLSPYYHYVSANFWDWQALLAYILVPTTIVLAVMRFRSKPLFAFSVGWFFLWLLPVSNIVPFFTLRQDRYLYLPSLVVAVFIAKAILTNHPLKSRPIYGLGVLAVTVLLLAGVTNSYLNTFANNSAMWIRAAETHPRWADAQFEAAYRCWAEKDLNCSMAYYRRTLDLEPKYAQALVNIGAILIDQGDYGRAKISLEQALVVDPDSDAAYFNLAVLALKTGEETEKIPQWIKKSEELKAKEKNNAARKKVSSTLILDR